jgi:hypothetical protein
MGIWNGREYDDRPEYKTAKTLDPTAMQNRQLFAAWRDRAALSITQSTAPPPDHTIAIRLALERMQEFALWADSQADSQSKGCHATFDIMQLHEQRDLTKSAINAIEVMLK